MSKVCTKCNQEKPLSEFSNSSYTKDGLMYVCKECNRETNRLFRQTPSGIYTNIKARSKYYGRPFNMERQEFIKWYEDEPKICAYCDVPEWALPLLGDSNNQKRIKLNIDRIVNDMGYQVNNLALCCTRCNYIKSDFFTFDEMREIAQKYVKSHWSKILEKQSIRGENHEA